MVTFYPFVDHAVPDVSGLSAFEQFPRPAPPVKINGVVLVGDMTSEQLHLASADDMKAAQDAIDEIEETVTEQGEAIAKLADEKQDKLSDEQIENIAAVPDKADEDDLPYALVEIYPTGDTFQLQDRAVNVVVPTVTATEEWVWSNGETGTPVYNDGYWTVRDASFEYDDDPGVAGTGNETDITFPLTDTQGFTYSYFDYDSYQFVITVNGDTIYATGEYGDEYDDMVVKTVEYNGLTYTLEYPFSQMSEGSTSNGTATLAEHVVTYTETYGPTITLTMPPAVAGHARDLIARIDLSQEAGAPPVAFSGGTFETADGEMPELVKGVNLLSFTETEAGVFGVAFKEMKPITVQGGA